MTRGELIYEYPLYSLKRFPTFLKYSLSVAKSIGGRRWLAVLMDMIWCNLRYGAMDSRDYMLFEFQRKSSTERNRFFTKRRYFRLIKHFNKEMFVRLADKDNMYEEYRTFIKRKWILINQNTEDGIAEDFISRHDKLLIKPVSSEQGRGISVVYADDNESIRRILETKATNPVILEELLYNCDEMQTINRSSLNTLRVFTIVPKGKDPIVINVSLRCGRGDSIVDNWGAGGICYPVDIESGIISSAGRDKKGNLYLFHPGSNMKMVGLSIPFYQEAIECAIECTKYNKDVLYAGIDIALTPDGPELVELNFPGGHDILQSIDQIGKNTLIQSII